MRKIMFWGCWYLNSYIPVRGFFQLQFKILYSFHSSGGNFKQPSLRAAKNFFLSPGVASKQPAPLSGATQLPHYQQRTVNILSVLFQRDRWELVTCTLKLQWLVSITSTLVQNQRVCPTFAQLVAATLFFLAQEVWNAAPRFWSAL